MKKGIEAVAFVDTWMKLLAKEGCSKFIIGMSASKKAMLPPIASEFLTTLRIIADVQEYKVERWTSVEEAQAGLTVMCQANSLKKVGMDWKAFGVDTLEEICGKLETVAQTTVMGMIVDAKSAKTEVTDAWEKMRAIDSKLESWNFEGLEWMFTGGADIDAQAEKIQTGSGWKLS